MASAHHRQPTSPPPAGQEIIPARRAFQQSALPGNQISNFQGHLIALQTSLQRIDRVRALPTAHQPPLDGDVCGVCLEDEVAGSVWRLLPCGHRFHTSCVDEWLYRPGGACPTCRKDPIVAMDAGVPPLSSLRHDIDNQEDDREDDGRPTVFTPTEELEMQEARRWTGVRVRDAWGQGSSQVSQTDLWGTDYSDDGGSTPADIERGSEAHTRPAPAFLRQGDDSTAAAGADQVVPLPSAIHEPGSEDDELPNRIFIPNPGGPGDGFYVLTERVVTVPNGPGASASETIVRGGLNTSAL